MVDWYLEDLSRLNGRPKATIADYVESNCILVPRRFASFDEAVASGVPILARSEYQDEYARHLNRQLVTGVSGLLESWKLKNHPGIKTEEELIADILKEPKIGKSRIKQYCIFTKKQVDEEKAKVSFSYWELLEGFNRTIVADSAIEGRYHVTSRQGFSKVNYSIYENGELTSMMASKLSGDLIGGIEGVIEFYEAIRKLDRFDPDNCPIVEFQTVNGKNYFLQYHRSRDFYPSTFTLDRPPRNEEMVAHFVRGATPEEGITCDVTTHYWWYHGMFGDRKMKQKLGIPKVEEGSFDLFWNQTYPEIMLPQRRLQFCRGGQPDRLLMQSVIGHLQRSKLFKPEVSLIVSDDDLIKLIKDEGPVIWERVARNRQDEKVRLNVVSDGRRAYFREVV